MISPRESFAAQLAVSFFRAAFHVWTRAISAFSQPNIAIGIQQF